MEKERDKNTQSTFFCTAIGIHCGFCSLKNCAALREYVWWAFRERRIIKKQTATVAAFDTRLQCVDKCVVFDESAPAHHKKKSLWRISAFLLYLKSNRKQFRNTYLFVVASFDERTNIKMKMPRSDASVDKYFNKALTFCVICRPWSEALALTCPFLPDPLSQNGRHSKISRSFVYCALHINTKKALRRWQKRSRQENRKTRRKRIKCHWSLSWVFHPIVCTLRWPFHEMCVCE